MWCILICLHLISLTWVGQAVSIFWWPTGTAQAAEVLYFRGFTGVGTAVCWEVLAVCWPSLTRLTKSAFSPLDLSNPLDSRQSWVSSCPRLKMAGAEAERSAERHRMAHGGCESCSSSRELGGSRQSSPWERAVLLRRMAEECRAGGVHEELQLLLWRALARGANITALCRWPAALVGVWHWRGLLWLMVIITNLACDTKILH